MQHQGETGAADHLLACPVCDALQRETKVEKGNKARCFRCGHVLMASRDRAMTQIVMLASTAFVLMLAGVFFPFLAVSAGGRTQNASLFDTILAYSTGLMTPLTVVLAAFIVILPLIRFLAILYTLAPMALSYYPLRHAKTAFRISELLRPWAMAEVFIVGCAVALVKVADMAQVGFGPAFWALCALVLVTVAYDQLMSSFTVWKTLDERQRR